MARPPRNDLAIHDMANHVRLLLDAKPSTAKDIERFAWRNLDLTVGNESIRKALAGLIDPCQCAIELLVALVAYFEVEPAELGRFAEERLRPILSFAGSIGHDQGPDTPGGQESDPSGWVHRLADDEAAGNVVALFDYADAA